MGLLSSGNAAGQLIFLPLLGRLSQDYGWQSVCIARHHDDGAILQPLGEMHRPEADLAGTVLRPLGKLMGRLERVMERGAS